LDPYFGREYYVKATNGVSLSNPGEYDLSELGSVTIDPDGQYIAVCHWEPPTDDYGSFPSPARVKFLIPCAEDFWRGMYVSDPYHRVVNCVSALPPVVPAYFWTNYAGCYEVT
jgi:hypothetical protein